MKYIKFTLFIFLGVFHFAGAQLPVSSAGGASVLFLRSGLSARVTGLGEAFTALADDENSLYYNPAGLFRMANTRFTLNHTQWFEDIKFDNLSFGYRIRDRAGIAFGISHMWMPQIQGKNEIGQNTGKLSVSSSIFQVGIGFPVLDNVYGGATVKYFSDNLASYVSSGFALDVGVFVYTIIPELTFGASVQNLGAKVKYNEASQDLPLTLRAGLAYSIPQRTINLSVDVLKSQGSGLKVNMGGEYRVTNNLSLRTGNQFSTGDLFTPSFGLGLAFEERYILNYTYFSNSDLGSTHRIGFTFNLYSPGKKAFRPQDNRPGSIGKKVGKITVQKPRNLRVFFRRDRIVIQWSKVENAHYNVYARYSEKSEWKKITPTPVKQNSVDYKIPIIPGRYYFRVTALVNGRESNFSDEAYIDVQ